MAERRTVMIGPGLEGRGGISSVVRTYQAHGLMERWGVRYVATQRGGGPARKALTAALAFARISVLALRGRIALLHAHSSSRSSFARKSLLLAVARAAGARTLLHLHSGAFDVFAAEEAGPALRWWIKRTLEQSTRVIVLSESWERFVRKLAPAARTIVIPNPVALTEGTLPDADRPGHRLLFLGRADRQKGVFELLDAIAKLVEEFPELELAVAGDGDLAVLRRYAESAGIADHLEVLGWIGPEECRHELSRACALVLPSFREGLPMAVLEAMAAGRPVVCTPVGGIPEAVRDEQEGLLVPPGDVPALTGALRRILSQPELCNRLGGQGVARVKAKYAADVVLDRLSRVYDELGARGFESLRERVSPIRATHG